MRNSTSTLSIRHLNKTYGGPRSRLMLQDINFELAPGEYVAVMGESGVGKSTLLNLIAGLDLPDSGSIEFEGAELTTLDDNARTLVRRDRMGFVFQAFHLLPHLTVMRNIMVPLALIGVEPDESLRMAGEMQRVAIARALVHRPRLVLADEPTGNLDTDTARQVLRVLREQIKRTAGGGVLVTHSAAAAATTDRVYVLTADGLQLRTER